LAERTRAEELCDWLRDQGYLSVKVLADGSVAMLGELLWTRAIFLGANEEGWAARFCFDDRELASKRFEELQSEMDEPKGYVARRYGS
jgi:hypothetical protein